MTDAMALLLNLITLAESGDASFKLEISRTYYEPEHFTPCKKVRVDGSVACVVNLDELMTASRDWPVFAHKVIERYMPRPDDVLSIPGFETE